ncbi:MAG: DUF1416 domain-containing protein [Microbacteriaceae bacterium]
MSCGAPSAATPLEEHDGGEAPRIEGTVHGHDGRALPGAYLRLLDVAGDFVGETVSDPAGRFRFFVRPGRWTVRALVPRSVPVDVPVVLTAGERTVSVAVGVPGDEAVGSAGAVSGAGAVPAEGVGSAAPLASAAGR